MGKPSLALTRNWWVTLREHDPVRFALAKAARRQWLPPLQDRLETHREGGTGPGSWERLAALLKINPATLFRWRSGKNARSSPSLKLQDLESFASMLRLSVHDLVPEPACQLAWAVEILCRGAVTPQEARAYSVYCHVLPVSHWETNGSWDGVLDCLALRGVVEAEVCRCEREAAQALWKVAECLEPVLRAIWPERG